MQYSSSSFAFAASLLATGAMADCVICDEVVVLGPSEADCFLERFDDFAADIAASPRGRATLDLAKCQGGTADGDRSVTTLPVVPSLPSVPTGTASEGPVDPAQGHKTAYLFDAAYADCLRELLAAHEGPIDPTVTFDLFEECQS